MSNKVSVKILNKSPFALPEYATALSAGMDIRANLSNVYDLKIFGNFSCDDEMQTLTLKPHSRVLMPTGIYLGIPEGYEVQMRSRSGLALKAGLMLSNGVGTIDSDYTGECCAILVNNSDKDVTISHGDRIAQIVLKEQPQIVWEEVETQEELGNTERGAGGFGHTGKK